MDRRILQPQADPFIDRLSKPDRLRTPRSHGNGRVSSKNTLSTTCGQAQHVSDDNPRVESSFATLKITSYTNRFLSQSSMLPSGWPSGWSFKTSVAITQAWRTSPHSPSWMRRGQFVTSTNKHTLNATLPGTVIGFLSLRSRMQRCISLRSTAPVISAIKQVWTW